MGLLASNHFTTFTPPKNSGKIALPEKKTVWCTCSYTFSLADSCDAAAKVDAKCTCHFAFSLLQYNISDTCQPPFPNATPSKYMCAATAAPNSPEEFQRKKEEWTTPSVSVTIFGAPSQTKRPPRQNCFFFVFFFAVHFFQPQVRKIGGREWKGGL